MGGDAMGEEGRVEDDGLLALLQGRLDTGLAWNSAVSAR